MKFVVLAQDIAAQQWLGRILNEAGLSDQPSCGCLTNSVQLTNSLPQANRVCQESDHGCALIVWSPDLTSVAKEQLLGLADQLILVDDTTASEQLAHCLNSGSQHAANCPAAKTPALAMVTSGDSTGQLGNHSH
jgi:hypothetical protein